MSPITIIKRVLSVPVDNPDLVLSQARALTHQIPLLYVILIANSAAVSYTHYHWAPAAITLIFPGVLSLFCTIRLVSWFRLRGQELSFPQAVKRLRQTMWLTPVLGIGFTTWGILIFPYGDDYARSHVAFYMAVTVIGCIFCLMHVKPAALMLTTIVVFPYTIYIVSTGNPVLAAIGINFLLVSCVMVVILINYYRDFASLIESRMELVERNADTKTLSDENFRLANLDSLTELPNRRRFFGNMSELIERCDQSGERFAVGLIDLDGFKPVNDIYGHAAGDRVLIEAGQRLREALPENVFLARLGGDEFGMLVEGNPSKGDVIALGEMVCAILQVRFSLPNASAQVAGSVGFACYPEAGTSPNQLLERADYALYHGKSHRRGRPTLFSAEHETAIRAYSTIEQCLRRADLDTEFFLEYQPIIDVAAGRVVAFEALARWHSPQLGRVSPADFIPVAERSDQISRLTQHLLRRALAAAEKWPADVRISFNLSVRDLTSEETALSLVTAVNGSGLPPSRLDFEITETALMRDFAKACEALRLFRALGAGISLDDFGTGYSSLSYVHRLPLDKIKIDRSFISEVVHDEASRKIVKSMLDLCRNLNVIAVVEGVETDEQVTVLRALGCHQMQGFLFGRSMPEAETARFLARFGRGESAA